MKRILATIILVFVFLFVAVATGVQYFLNGMEEQYLRVLYAELFTEAVDRSIQLDRAGEMKIPRVNIYGKTERLPPGMQSGYEILREIQESGASIDCSLGFEMPRVDPFQYSPSIGALLSYRPFRYVVVFEGRPPDMDPILSATPDSELIGDIDSMDPMLSSELTDFTSSFTCAMEEFPRGILWSATECEKYSFIIFEEV